MSAEEYHWRYLEGRTVRVIQVVLYKIRWRLMTSHVFVERAETLSAVRAQWK